MKTFFILFLLSTTAWSYPVFFKCEEGGRLSDQVTPPELRGRLNALVDSLRSLNSASRTAKIDEYCEGGALCMQEFEQLLRMSEVNGTITRDIIDAELARVRAAASAAARAENGIAPVSEGLFASALSHQQMTESILTVRECRVALANFAPERFNNNGNCVLANFGHSPYMYPSGIRFSGTGYELNHKQVNCEAVQSMVQGALAMDEDPFAAIAISLMENGTEISDLYLDPIGSVQTLGCPTTRGTPANHNMDSFSTYYNVQNGLRENPALVRNIQNLMRLQNVTPQAGESYLCNTPGAPPEFAQIKEQVTAYITANPNSEPTPELQAQIDKIIEKYQLKYTNLGCAQGSSSFTCTQPLRNHCCVRLPFKTDRLDVSDRALTYSSLNRYLSSPLEPNIRGTNPSDYPARRLQRFNGFSDAMGGAEGVSAWRSGVNYYQTPSYGHQALDFILNTLWNNPFVRSAVAAAEQELGKKSKSVLCQDRGPGVYTIEHDHYFRQHAEAPRMTAILARWNQNASWASLPKRFQRVLTGEFTEICKRKDTPTFCGHVSRKNSQAAATEYFRTVYRTRRTVAQASRQDQGFTWGQMSHEQFSGFLNRYREVLDGSNPMSDDY